MKLLAGLKKVMEDIDLFMSHGCPECKSKDYISEFIFKPNIVVHGAMIRHASLGPYYRLHCNECNHEWYV